MFGQLKEVWGRLSPFGRVVVASLFTSLVLYGGSKSSSPPRGGPLMLTARRDAELRIEGGIDLRSPGAPSSLSETDTMARNWNRRGAWRDSMQFDFHDGWVFPWGSNHFSRVEVVSSGEIWPRWNDTNAIASVGVPLAIPPGEDVFSHSFTPSNSYLFVWSQAYANRFASCPIDASIELMRNGDVVVATNGVTEHVARTLPFAHDGYGQDVEWVAANFTNATEILAAGYASWVDAQVGEGLTNGLYKFTATFPEDPPEAVRLWVGGFSVAVTNAGDYVFLLEKGVEYEYGTEPFQADVECSSADDVAQARSLSAAPEGETAGVWRADGGVWRFVAESPGLPGSFIWLPTLCGSPDIGHMYPGDDGIGLFAGLTDWRGGEGFVSFSWSGNAGHATFSPPDAQSTYVTFDSFPSWREETLSVTAAFGTNTLVSTLDMTYGTNDAPQVYMSLSLPQTVLKDCLGTGSVSFTSDVATNGVLKLMGMSNADKVRLWYDSGMTQRLMFGEEWQAGDFEGFYFFVEGIEGSANTNDVAISFVWLEDGSAARVDVADMTVAECGDVIFPSAPDTGLVVLKGAPVVFKVDLKPHGAVLGDNDVDVDWDVGQLRSDGTWEGWRRVADLVDGLSYTYFTETGGIFKVKATVHCGGAQSVSHSRWQFDEPQTTGLSKRGDILPFGVVDEQWQLNLRNAALGSLGSTAYSFGSILPAQFGYSMIKRNEWKCNIFVAHQICFIGLAVPHNETLFHTYPPVANDWACSDSVSGWEYLGTQILLQPGYVVGSPSAFGSGHCGIVDFDGNAIAAGANNVNRKFEHWLSESTGYHKVEEVEE